MANTLTKRYYLDFNATAPLSKMFIKALGANRVLDGNASSIHSTGKAVAKSVAEVETFLFNHFCLDRSKFKVIFHSGATEAANTFSQMRSGEVLAYFASDHSCIKAQATRLKEQGVKVVELPVKENGAICVENTIKILESDKDKKILLHFTQMNNEIGTILSLDKAIEIKRAIGCLVYVDCVQGPGRIQNYNKLREQLDIYTFSGHKFGALKGIGFSFYKTDFEFKPLLLGGEQQGATRSGTINSQGIISLKYALEDLSKKQIEDSELTKLKNSIIDILQENQELIVIENESLNTISFIHKKLSADIMLIHFDMAGLNVSSGSACSSGSTRPSHVIEALGYGDLASNSIRISLGHSNLRDSAEILSRVSLVASKL